MRRHLSYLFILISFSSTAQVKDSEMLQKQFRCNITKTNEPIVIDGVFNENIWATSAFLDSFYLKYPTDIGRPKRTTQVRITYDENFIYFGFTAFDSGKSFIQTLKRDSGHDGNDGVAIILDPTNQRTNGFFFVVNAFNAQSEDQLPLGNGSAWNWDNKWYSATKRYKDRWTAEIAIPFKTLRYTSDKLLWGLNLLRVDTKANEYSVWTPIPVNFPSHTLTYTGALIWDKPLPKTGSNAVFIPYITGGLSQDRQNNTSLKGTANAGFDGKLALSSSLNLDITANPDFSQVEVDRQVTNLTRFNIFFPERRTFFLENAGLFSNIGNNSVRPFYSRTIGLDKDGQKVPIIGGARLSGNLDKFTRIGLLNIQTAQKGEVAAQNYTASTIQRRVLKNSTIQAYFLNKENFISIAKKEQQPLEAYGRNAGVEFNYNNLKSTWGAWGGYHHSLKPGITKDNNFFNTGGNFNGRNFSALINVSTLGTNYFTDMGFSTRVENYDATRDTVVRVGYKDIYTESGYRLYPKKGKVGMHNFNFSNYVVFNPDNSFNERNTGFNYSLQLKNTSNISANANNNTINLIYPISFTARTPLPVARYSYTQYRAGYSSDFRKPISVNLNGGIGGFYNGTYRSLRAGINVRKQPHLNVGLNAEYNKLVFPTIYGNTELFLLSSRVEINFSTAIFWTTFLQYNTQRNNFNINSRLQYRFKPLSDFFLVYTDNYFTDPLFKNKNRAIVFKMNYWLNI